MLNLFFDVETTGLTKDKLPSADEGQPHLLQLAAKLVEDDGRVRGRLTTIIKPEGWSIEPAAEMIHGISERTAHRVGMPLVKAIAAFSGMVDVAGRIVGFNLHGFDRKIIDASIRRVGANDQWWTRRANAMFCVMETATPIMQLPGQFGFKQPKLTEAFEFFCGEPYETKHDAEEDAEATARIYFALVKRLHPLQQKT